MSMWACEGGIKGEREREIIQDQLACRSFLAAKIKSRETVRCWYREGKAWAKRRTYYSQQIIEGGWDQQGERGGEREWGVGIKTDRDGERMCEEVCVSEGASVCVKAKQSVAVAEAVQRQQ